MTKYLLLIFSIFLCISCDSNQLGKEFSCESPSPNNLETVEDFKKKFSVKFPKHWKINLYYEDAVSSIYAADTTLALSKATLIDVSFINNPDNIDDNFVYKVKKDNEELQLTEVKANRIKFKRKDAYYNLAKGKRGKFNYHILNFYSKTQTGFIHAKTEIYGDSLIDSRLCSAITLLNKIQLK
ncbi:hypothetical protein [Tenacibaculum jejuense]|uniref:Probable lipoprotein n=1 Tax=Tenacibaculum jejuense TaxID=584609 RepID=A0A238UC74_9FLAO|nr:hypothetical protein [Tenacibaculum jejuense]SNR16074.1 Probable lipoprotein precursor [Tenacibaculum jejuense]